MNDSLLTVLVFLPVAGAALVALTPREAEKAQKTIALLVTGDRLGEPNETFFINLSHHPSGGYAFITDGQGQGTILDDEPRIVINDVTLAEGRSGLTSFVFTVTLLPHGAATTRDRPRGARPAPTRPASTRGRAARTPPAARRGTAPP